MMKAGIERALAPGSWAVMRPLLLVMVLLLLTPVISVSAAERTLLPVNRDPVILVLDASGSMGAALGKKTRLDAARRILLDTISLFPADRPVGLVAYGHRRKDDCGDIETLRPLGPVDMAAIRQSLVSLRARGKTPLSGALRHAADLLPKGGGTIMLVSDGLETCNEDPCAVAETLKKANAGLIIHVVGFGLAEGEMKGLACIAEKGGGRAIETSNATGLERALKTLTAQPDAGSGGTADAVPTETEKQPATPPPPTPKPVVLRAVIGGDAVPGAVLFTVANAGGETIYSGKGTEVTPSLVPGRYTLRLVAGNIETQTALTVAGSADERHDVPLNAGLVRLSVVAAEGLAVADTDIKGDPVWIIVPKDGQAPAVLDGVIAPAAMLAPGRYAVTVSLGGFEAATEIAVVAGKAVEGTADLKLGKVTLEAGLPGAEKPLESGTGLSYALSGAAGAVEQSAEAVARPTFLVPAGAYTAKLRIAGAVIEQAVTAEAGKAKTVRIDLPSAELALEGSLGSGAPAFTDWRDATWTVRPVTLIGDAKAGAALEDKAEAAPRLTLLPGKWSVTLTSGQASAMRQLMLAPGAQQAERIELNAARLSVTAAPEDGATPPLNVVISIFAANPDGGFAEKPIAEAGTRRDYSTILPAGRYRISAKDETGRAAVAEPTLVSGQSEDLRLSLQ